jgi:glutathione synthase/RimK-type ligase-like ATP-grasp enzyme
MASTVVAFATSERIPGLTDDDRLLVRALEARGIIVEPAVWSDATLDWRRYAAVVIRSCWDYHRRIDEFMALLDHLETAGVRVLNPPALIRWNADKRYLAELAGKGVPVVPTRFVNAGQRITLSDVMRETTWEEVVVKPAVSASAHDTWRSVSGADDEARFRELAARGTVLVQPFLPIISADGEWSLLFYGDVYSHAVLKRPRDGDFRVQKEHGGSSEAATAPGHVVDAAAEALHASERGRSPALYARVDCCVIEGKFALMEMELIEPDLFMRFGADAPEKMACALIDTVQKK